MANTKGFRKREIARLAEIARDAANGYYRPLQINPTNTALEKGGLIEAAKLPNSYYYYVVTDAGRTALEAAK